MDLRWMARGSGGGWTQPDHRLTHAPKRCPCRARLRLGDGCRNSEDLNCPDRDLSMPGGHITEAGEVHMTSTKPTAETLQPPRRASAPAQQRGSMPILDCRHRRRHRADGDA